MMVLVMDTCLEPGSLALQEAELPPEVVPLPPGWRSTTVQEEIALLLARHGLTTEDITGYGVTTGQGSFTGVRIGLTVAKALAEVHNRPIVPVSTLEVMAIAARETSRIEPSTVLAPILDARRGQIFGGAYQMDGEGLRPIVETTVGSLRSFLEEIKRKELADVRFCGMDLDSFLAEIETAGWEPKRALRISPSLAGFLAKITVDRLRKGLGVPAVAVDANYVRASDAELFWKE